MENEKLALEKENLRRVMDNFSVSTELSVVAVKIKTVKKFKMWLSIYMEKCSCPAPNMKKTHSASIFSPSPRAESGADAVMKRRAKKPLNGMNLISSAAMAGW